MAEKETPKYAAEDFVVVKRISGGSRLGKAIVRDPNPSPELYEIPEADCNKHVVEIEYIDTGSREYVYQESLEAVRCPPLPKSN